MKKEQKQQDEIESSNASLIEHLTELRSRLILSVLAFLICMVCVFPFSKYIFNVLAMPITELLAVQNEANDLIFTGLQQGFMVNVKMNHFLPELDDTSVCVEAVLDTISCPYLSLIHI